MHIAFAPELPTGAVRINQMHRMQIVFSLFLIPSVLSLGCSKPPENVPTMPTKKVVFLVKANDDLISHCHCQQTFIGAPSQMDCPWCGCGWLFICPKCRRAFTFARAEECDLSWDQLAHNDLDGKYGKQPTAEDVQEWISFMQMMTKNIEVGKQYVYIDGWVKCADEKHLHFEGVHAHHELDVVPQSAALHDREILEQTLGRREYWQERRVQNN